MTKKNAKVAKSPAKHKGRSILIQTIARVAHNVNAAYCASIGDFSQVPWEKASAEQQESCMLGVELHINNPLAGPEASHEAWFLNKKMNGWVHGKKKNEELKIHPCMVAFADLPVEQQAKDHIFRAIVINLAAAVGSDK